MSERWVRACACECECECECAVIAFYVCRRVSGVRVLTLCAECVHKQCVLGDLRAVCVCVCV